MILDRNETVKATSPEQEEELKSAGYTGCYNGQCNLHFSPQMQSAVMDNGGYYTCPHCKQSYDLKEETPYMRPEEHEQAHYLNDFGGGGTIVGLSMNEQAQIGEDLVKGLGTLPGYGPITWWHEGGTESRSPLDGATPEWGIEVKTLAYDAKHHRFIPGRPQEKMAKNKEAEERGFKGVLGILVLLDYRRSVADIYAQAMPFAGWKSGNQNLKGVASFRSLTAQHLIKEVPFHNPYMDPENESPSFAEPKQDMPF